ncbi:MerR family transcriptional regulator [Henriciella barbarensis]|uniref:MerR family transcriptional regulator n=1 Tax=Henriciella barbarensis TaxID=86342 RepID=A0A399R7Z0_9PROT|nr:MerR family transcriptional regulator [Henriciella barbarensis]RIJ26155.1 MerR family transcriptional regulator [Henriciella barbarensis]
MGNAAKRIKKSAAAYRSIGEAAEELGLQPHVLRYWEGKFKRHLKPMKRPDGRRMYRPEDIRALQAIKILVHEKGFTLKGAGQLLNEQGLDAVLDGAAVLGSHTTRANASTEGPARKLQEAVRDAFSYEDSAEANGPKGSERLETMLSDLMDIKARLDAARLRKAA